MSTTVGADRAESPWLRSRGFDLGFLTLSAVLVFFPYAGFGLLQRAGISVATASLVVGLSVTVLVGGPHMYSTYLRTALEPSFRSRFGWLAYLPLVLIPTLVILGSVYAFPVLLTAFFFWASVHVTHQAQFISEAYRRKTQAVSRFDRLLDGAVILGSLYTMAMFKFVRGEFVIGSQPLLFPRILRHEWIPYAFAAGFAALLTLYIGRTIAEIRAGVARWPRLLFMALTISMAFVVPLFDNLDVSFQGFNTWHSLQYLALTWFILDQRASRDQITSDFVKKISGKEKTARYYLAMIGFTLSAGVIYLFLWKGLGFPQDQCYYVVVLSFLLIHYFYDHILFGDFEALPAEAPERLARA
ncbi:MAG: hypothetical protein ACRD16_13610 [Thermoanaerobaculia bacterium]